MFYFLFLIFLLSFGLFKFVKLQELEYNNLKRFLCYSEIL